MIVASAPGYATILTHAQHKETQMSTTQETSIWDDFGVSGNDVVTSGGEDQNHVQEMLALNVDTRDGDTSIDLADEGGEILTEEQLRQRMAGEQSDVYGDQGDDSIRVNTETGDADDQEEQAEDESEPEDVDLSETPEELTSSITALKEHTNGFNAMVDKALEGGEIDEQTLEAIKAEYAAGDTLSEKTYTLLETKGYSRGFVNSFIQGQELLATAYADQIVRFVGGADNFNNTRAYLESTNPAMAEMLDTALETLDVKAITAIFESAKTARSARFGKAPTRSVTQRASTAKPTAAASKGVQPFDSIDDMMKAMDDPRYRNDARYRQQVEARITARS